MKAKKIFAVLLGSAMVFSMAACGSSSDNDDAAGGSSVQTSETESADKEAADSEEISAEEESFKEESSEKEITFEETTFVDNEYCVFTVKGITKNEDGSCTLDVDIENKSTDQRRSFWVSAVVDGVVEGNAGYVDDALNLEAGTKVNTELSIYSDVAELGYTDLEITLDVQDEVQDSLTEETFHVYPYGEENAVVFERETQDSDQILLDNDYLTLTLIGPEYDDNDLFRDYYIQNKSDKSIIIRYSNLSIDGYTISSDSLIYLVGMGVSAGKEKEEMTFWDTCEDELADNGIENPKQLEMTVTGTEEESGDVLFEETVTANLQ